MISTPSSSGFGHEDWVGVDGSLTGFLSLFIAILDMLEDAKKREGGNSRQYGAAGL